MYLEDEEKIFIQLAKEHIRGDKFKRFIQFCFKHSDEIVICYLDQRVKSRERLNEYQLIRYEETCHTHCTKGPLTTVYHFKNENNIKQRMDEMQDLYDFILLDEEGSDRGEDPAFYKEGELICSICSHESIGRLFLDEQQYKEFYSLRIPHEVYNLNKQLSFEERLEEYAYQEREYLTIHGLHEQSIPESIGKLKSLRVLEIFDHEVAYLPKTLEELTALECLRITDNRVEGLDFDISRLKNLRKLDLSAMPLKVFPDGIIELTQLEELYLSGMKAREVPETIMKLNNLRVLALPQMEYTQYSSEFIEFIERLKPKTKGIPLKDILGKEQWERIMKSDGCITKNEDYWCKASELIDKLDSI